MSHFVIPPTDAEPPLDEQPFPSDEERTLDLGEPGIDDLTLDDAAVGAAAAEVSAQDEVAYESGEADETIDLPVAPEAALVGCELQQGKYQVLALRPGMLAGLPLPGASYTALHTDLQRRLTLYHLPLDPDATEEERNRLTNQFLREVRVLAKLSHPSLPRVHDYFCENTACYVVMDELSERTLADALAEARQRGTVPALPPMMLAQVGLELVRALGYLHQQRPPLVLGTLRAEGVAVPADGPVQLMSLGALSIVASASSGSLPGFVSLPTLPVVAVSPESLEEAAGEEAKTPEPEDDLYSLGLLLRELAGGAEVVAKVMERLQHPEEALQADGADDAPPISLALAGVIQIAAHDEPGRRFQNAAAFETALLRAWMVERRIVRQAERGWRDEQATRLENGDDDVEATSVDVTPSQIHLHREVATRNFSLVPELNALSSPSTICWRCGGHNEPGALVCRVCGARQPVPGEQNAAAYAPVFRPQERPTRKLPNEADELAWDTWDEAAAEDATVYPRSGLWLTQNGRQTAARRRSGPAPGRPRVDEQPLLWGLVWACFSMALALGSATIVLTYLALH